MLDFAKYKNRLLDYLRLKGIEPSENNLIRCFSPDHTDKNPSCGVRESDFCCFGCGIRGDIYDAIEIIENIPDKKAQFDFAKNFFKEADHA
jgi:DNA primase